MTSPSTSSTAGQLEVRRVSKVFNPEEHPLSVVEDCSLLLERHKLTVMVGPSACGKSTLINLIAGYERPTSGEIILDGMPVGGPSPDRLVVFQGTALFPWMTILDNVAFGPRSRGVFSRREAENQALTLLEKVGLRGFANRYPQQLSGGMQRRAELVRALINQPRVMLMDEPFRGLDAMTRQLMQEHFLRLFEEQRGTTLFVTHDLDEAIFLGDRVLLTTARPAQVRRVLEIDLPRPRDFHVLSSQRYQELWSDAMETLNEEAAKAFSGGATLIDGLIEETLRRRQPESASEVE